MLPDDHEQHVEESRKRLRDGRQRLLRLVPSDHDRRRSHCAFWIQISFIHGAEGGTTYRAGRRGRTVEFRLRLSDGCLFELRERRIVLVAELRQPPGPLQPGVVPPYDTLFVDFRIDEGAHQDQLDSSESPVLAVDAAGSCTTRDRTSSIRRCTRSSAGWYAYGYDAAALAMNAIIDCEPIFFDYAGKTWLIELWKGQYGLETGCEIGVYNRTIGSTSFVYSMLDAPSESDRTIEPVAQPLLRLRNRQRVAVDVLDALSQGTRSSAAGPRSTGG